MLMYFAQHPRPSPNAHVLLSPMHAFLFFKCIYPHLSPTHVHSILQMPMPILFKQRLLFIPRGARRMKRWLRWYPDLDMVLVLTCCSIWGSLVYENSKLKKIPSILLAGELLNRRTLMVAEERKNKGMTETLNSGSLATRVYIAHNRTLLVPSSSTT